MANAGDAENLHTLRAIMQAFGMLQSTLMLSNPAHQFETLAFRRGTARRTQRSGEYGPQGQAQAAITSLLQNSVAAAMNEQHAQDAEEAGEPAGGVVAMPSNQAGPGEAPEPGGGGAGGDDGAADVTASPAAAPTA